MTKAKSQKMPRYYKPTYQGRPLQYVKDREGNSWLCDKGVAGPWSDPREKGCWCYEEMAFPTGGR